MSQQTFGFRGRWVVEARRQGLGSSCSVPYSYRQGPDPVWASGASRGGCSAPGAGATPLPSRGSSQRGVAID